MEREDKKMKSKKLVSAITALTLIASTFFCVSLPVKAAGTIRTLNQDLVVDGYTKDVFYNFQNNTPAVLPTSGDFRYRDGGVWGLHNYGSGGRSATATIPVTADDILVIQNYTGYTATINRGAENTALSTSTGYQVFDITSTANDVTFTVPRYGGIVAALVMYKPTATSIAPIVGSDTILLGESESYSTDGVFDQKNKHFADATLSIQTPIDGVTLADGVISVSSTVPAGTEITLVASYSGLDNVTKTVTVTSDAGYILKTTPYSIVTVDGTNYNSGYTGAVQFPVGTTGEKVVTITKSGYSDRTESVTFADNQDGTYTLTPSETGVTYYEDFTNVNDRAGFAGEVGQVSNNTISAEAGASQTSDTWSLPNAINVSDKLITINAKVTNNANRSAYFNIKATDDSNLLATYYRTGQFRVNLSKGDSGDLIGFDTNFNALQLTVNNDKSVNVYFNGKHIYKTTTTALDLAGLYLNPQSRIILSIDSIKVSNIPSTYTFTTVNGYGETTTSPATYLAGSTVTLPAATTVEGYEFTGWLDGTNMHSAGETVTVNSDVTYTAQYEQIVPKLVLTEKSAFATETGATGTVRFSTTVDNKLNWDDSNSTLTGIGYAIVNVNDWSTISTKMSEFNGKDYIDKSGSTSIELGSDKPFFYEIHGISPDVHGVKFYAVPYLVYNINSASTTFWGAPITHSSEFDWNTTNAAKLDSTIEHTAVGSN